MLQYLNDNNINSLFIFDEMYDISKLNLTDEIAL